MNKSPKNEQGFGVVEGILVLVILILIGAVGYMVYKNHHHSTPVAKSVSTSSVKPSTIDKVTPAPTTTATPSDSSLVLQRQQYIDNYIAANTSEDWTAAYYAPLYQSGYLSTKLYNVLQAEADEDNNEPNSSANPAYDELICINELPSSYTYGTITLSGTTAALPISDYVSGSTIPTHFIASWIKTNGVWQLNYSACYEQP